jgi:FkbM family methyltransferase
MAPFVYPQVYRCPDPAAAARAADPAFKLAGTSQCNEDRFLWERVFQPRGAGAAGLTFLEIGALDGSLYANTKAFEAQLDWRGVLVEGFPGNSARLRASAGAGGRPNSAVFTHAVCGVPAPGDGGVTALPGTVQFAADAGSSGARGSIVAADTEAFREHWHSEGGVADVAKRHDVACVPLQWVIDAAGLADINLFSLDVEGAEAIVLRTVDWAVTNAEFVLVEMDGHNPDKDADVRAQLAAAGFAVHPINMKEGCSPGAAFCADNVLFVNPRFEERRAARAAAAGANATQLYQYGTGKRCNATAAGGSSGGGGGGGGKN